MLDQADFWGDTSAPWEDPESPELAESGKRILRYEWVKFENKIVDNWTTRDRRGVLLNLTESSRREEEGASSLK